jgi:hypothetical protein
MDAIFPTFSTFAEKTINTLLADFVHLPKANLSYLLGPI